MVAIKTIAQHLLKKLEVYWPNCVRIQKGLSSQHWRL